MIKDTIVVGSHAFFFPAGSAFTLPANGVSSRTAKPGSTDTGWINLGVSEWTKQNTGTTADIKAPAPGIRVLWKKVPTSRGLKLKGKLKEMQNLVWKLLLSTAPLPQSPDAGGQYNPMGGDPLVEGWLQIQQYNQYNQLVNTMDVFVAMTLPGDVSFGEAPLEVDVECDCYWSALNTGSLQ